MDAFRDRERAAEAYFAHELQVKFVERMGRVRALGEWAAQHMGIDAPGGDTYIHVLERIATVTPDDSFICQKVARDFKAARVDIPLSTIERTFAGMAASQTKQPPAGQRRLRFAPRIYRKGAKAGI